VYFLLRGIADLKAFHGAVVDVFKWL